MLNTLLRIRLKALFATMFARQQKKKRGVAVKILLGVFAVYLVACFFIMFAGLFSSVAGPFEELGVGWAYFALVGLVCVGLCFIGSVFMTQSQIYEANDNELLLSMPIPPGIILLSRVAALYIYNLFYALLIMVPGAAVWLFFRLPVTVPGAVFYLLGVLLLPLLALTLSLIFGWLLTLVTSRVRNKSLVSTLFSLVFLAVYFLVYSRISSYINYLVENGTSVAEAIRRSLPPAWFFGSAVRSGGLLPFLWFLLCVAIPFGLVYALLSRTLVGMLTTHRGMAKKVYRGETLKANSVDGALLGRELRRFWSCPAYMLNSGFGLLLMVVGAVMLLLRKSALESALGDLSGAFGVVSTYFFPILAILLCSISAMNQVSAPSVSLEGRARWITQSMPVEPGRVLLAKARMHNLICLPFVFLSAVIGGLCFPGTLLGWAALLITPLTFTAFVGYLGVLINVKMPRFDWQNEAVCVKQSMSVLVGMLLSFVAVIVPVCLYLFLPGPSGALSPELFTLLCGVIYALGAVALRQWLLTRGGKIYATL